MKEQKDLDGLGDGGEVELDTLPPGFRLPPPQTPGGEEVLESHQAPGGSGSHGEAHAPAETRRLKICQCFT